MKYLLIVSAALALSGCGTLAGNYEETLAIDKNGNVVVSKLTGRPLKLKKRQSRSSAIAEQLTKSLQAISNSKSNEGLQEISCYSLQPNDVLKLSPSAQTTYIKGVNSCIDKKLSNAPMLAMAKALVSATQPVSDYARIAQEATKSISVVERQTTNRIKAIANPLALTLGIRQITSTISTQSDNLRDVGVAAAKSGNTTVGNINVATSNSTLTSGADGDGSTASTATQSGSTPNIAIGNNNNIATSTDEARSFSGTESTLQNNSNGVSSQNNNSKSNGNQVADDLEGTTQVEDEDGNPDLF